MGLTESAYEIPVDRYFTKVSCWEVFKYYPIQDYYVFADLTLPYTTRLESKANTLIPYTKEDFEVWTAHYKLNEKKDLLTSKLKQARKWKHFISETLLCLKYCGQFRNVSISKECRNVAHDLIKATPYRQHNSRYTTPSIDKAANLLLSLILYFDDNNLSWPRDYGIVEAYRYYSKIKLNEIAPKKRFPFYPGQVRTERATCSVLIAGTLSLLPAFLLLLALSTDELAGRFCSLLPGFFIVSLWRVSKYLQYQNYEVSCPSYTNKYYQTSCIFIMSILASIINPEYLGEYLGVLGITAAIFFVIICFIPEALTPSYSKRFPTYQQIIADYGDALTPEQKQYILDGPDEDTCGDYIYKDDQYGEISKDTGIDPFTGTLEGYKLDGENVSSEEQNNGELRSTPQGSLA